MSWQQLWHSGRASALCNQEVVGSKLASVWALFLFRHWLNVAQGGASLVTGVVKTIKQIEYIVEQ